MFVVVEFVMWDVGFTGACWLMNFLLWCGTLWFVFYSVVERLCCVLMWLIWLLLVFVITVTGVVVFSTYGFSVFVLEDEGLVLSFGCRF